MAIHLPTIVSVPADKNWYYGIIDSIKIITPTNSVRTNDIERIKTIVNAETGEVDSYSGSIKNLKISWGNGNLSIFGSLAKYFYGDHNLNLLIQAQYKMVIKELSKKLGVDLMPGRIRRLDTAIDVYVHEMTVRSYMRLFENSPGMIKTDSGANTLYYTNEAKRKSKQITIYDKTEEMKDDGFTMQGESIMRIENRLFTLGIRRYMKLNHGKTTLLVEDLFNKDIYIGLVKEIEKEYFAIVKKKIGYFALTPSSKPTDIVTYLAVAGIEYYGGIENVLLRIDATKSKFKPPYATFFPKVKAIARKVSCNKKCTKKHGAIINLDNQVRLIAKFSIWHVGVVD